jgi:8-oxo-dGTP pyrophosphatase MutT (NUDIX family)
MAREKSAGAVVYRVTEDGNLLYLLLQPAPGKPWGFPKGKLDKGETEEQAARREISEEAGLPAVEFETNFRHVVHYTYRRGRSVVRKDVIYFLAQTMTAEVRISWEHSAYRWATVEDALDLVVYENAQEVLRQAHEHLLQRYGLAREG